MLKGKILVVVFLLSIIALTANAYALPQPPGTEFHFLDIEYPTTNPWTHNLQGSFYNEPLECTEPYLIIERARLILSLNFTPELVGEGKNPYAFMAYVTLDGLPISTKLIKYSFKDDDLVTKTWRARITNPSALNAIANKSAEIKINMISGTLNSVNSSTLRGNGVVAPEPISMVLVGVGIAGLPVAGRIRRFIKKG